MCFCCSAVSIKMWYPQILQTINDVNKETGGTDVQICNIIDSLAQQNTFSNTTCIVVSNNDLQKLLLYYMASCYTDVKLFVYFSNFLLFCSNGKFKLLIFIEFTCYFYTLLLPLSYFFLIILLLL